MRTRSIRLLAGLGALAVLAACQSTKSANPLSPSVAGPIPGVTITAPKLLEPGAGSKVTDSQQPISLVVENATTNGQRPLSYVFEVATDAGCTNKVFSREGISPGDGGRTSLRLPDRLATGRTYYWRARALDGANTGPFPAAANFDVYTPVVIDAPVPVAPVGGVKVTTLRPTFIVNNSSRTGPAGAISYTFELSESDTFAVKVAVTVAEQTNQTQYVPTADLAYAKTYYWHVRGSDGTATGPWSATQVFKTPDKPEPPPEPPAPPSPPSPPGGNDAIDLRQVVIVKGPGDFANWTVGSTITDVRQGNGQLCIYHTMLGQWPSVPFFGDPGTLVEGNQWVFAFINGRWYGGAADWYRPGQACKGVDAQSIGRDAFYNPSEEPLHSWVPQPGERVGYGSSTPARAWPDMRTLDHRTNIVIVPWQ